MILSQRLPVSGHLVMWKIKKTETKIMHKTLVLYNLKMVYLNLMTIQN